MSKSTRVEVGSSRKYDTDEKKRIVAEYRAASDTTGRNAVLRRYGTFQQSMSRWGAQIDAGTLGVRAKPAKGRNKDKDRARALEKQLARSRERVATLEELVAAQGKVLALTSGVVVSAPDGL